METRARYILVGLFTAAVIGTVFAFIYWLDNASSLRDKAVYQIRFENPVTGLQVGAGVTFNGIRVGEVTELHLNQERPRELTAVVAVDSQTPVRTDTRIGIDFQGVTGIATILLTGGSPSAAIVTSADGQPPVLIAPPKAGRNWTQAAGVVLERVDGILEENAEPLHKTLTSLGKFSEALARNSDRIDGILAGLERMTGGTTSKAKAVVYDLTPPQEFPPLVKEPAWQLVIPEPTVLLALNTDKIMLQTGPGETTMLADARWSDNLPILFQEKLIQSFENAGYLRSVLRPMDELEADYKLQIDIRGFALSTYSSPAAKVEFVAKILTKDGKVVAAREFGASVAATATDAKAASATLAKAFAKSVTELILWTVGEI